MSKDMSVEELFDKLRESDHGPCEDSYISQLEARFSAQAAEIERLKANNHRINPFREIDHALLELDLERAEAEITRLKEEPV